MSSYTEDNHLLATKVQLKGDDTDVELKSLKQRQSNSPPPSYDAVVPEQTRRLVRGPLAPVNNCLTFLEESVKTFVKENKKTTNIAIGVISLILYIIYFCFAVTLDFERARNLVYITIFASICFLYWLIKKFFGQAINDHCCLPLQKVLSKFKRPLKWIGILLFMIFVVAWIIYDTIKDTSRLISLAGLIVYILIGFLFSKHRDKINWQPVFLGFALQFIFGLLILRTQIGLDFFQWLGDRVSIFLSFSSAGTEFLFGDIFNFAFSVLPVIVFFSAFTYVCFYLGVLQGVITKIAYVLQITMGTSPAESINAAGNIFIGQTEAPLLIRPFLNGMTKSELHAVMTGGFATIAGSVLAAYVKSGISASHLLSASVMSAPAALAMAKLMYPETEEPEFKNVDDIEVEKTDEKNVFEALAVGASMSISLVANIAVMLIAFLSMLKLANEILGWFGGMIGLDEFSFEFICSYVFMPFAYIMGVSWDDAFIVGELLGVKTFLNEFIAYKRLGALIFNRVNENDKAQMSIRSEVITTYALCGFANFGSMGVQLGGISALAPSRRPVLAKVVFRALIAGTMACFMTACIAGLLYDEGKYDTTITKAPPIIITTMNTLINSTVSR